jgi:hypothetical protein
MIESPAADGVSGTLRGGQSPVTNATIQLYAVGTTGDGSAATPLLKSTVMSDGSGNFSITNLFTCPAGNPLVYLTATGGNPGLTPGTNNPNLAMMAALGPCNNLSSSSYVVINELTTIASVFNLAPYMTSYSDVGSGSSDAAAMATAFSTVLEYVDTTHGTGPGPTLPVGSSASTTKLNTLGDVLAPCVNSAGGAAGDGSPCGLLFSFTKPASGPAPTDTIGAALAVALTPVNPNRFLSILVTPTAPFQPSIAGDPASWALQILALQSISVSPANPSVNNGSTIQVSATGTYADLSTANLTNLVTWTSSDNSLATASSTGLITGKSPGGPVTITATLGTTIGSTSLTVASRTLQSLVIVPLNPSAIINAALPLSVTGHFSDGSSSSIPSAVWSSSNTTVAVFNYQGAINGSVYGLAAGTSTVTATVGAVSTSTLLTVYINGQEPLPTLTSINVSSCHTFTDVLANCKFSWTAINLHAGDSYILAIGQASNDSMGGALFDFTATGPTFDNTGDPVVPTQAGVCGTPNNVSCQYLWYNNPDNAAMNFLDFGGSNFSYLQFNWVQ